MSHKRKQSKTFSFKICEKGDPTVGIWGGCHNLKVRLKSDFNLVEESDEELSKRLKSSLEQIYMIDEPNDIIYTKGEWKQYQENERKIAHNMELLELSGLPEKELSTYLQEYPRKKQQQIRKELNAMKKKK